MKLSNRQLANQWRQQHNYQGGVVVLFCGEVQGWVNELRDAEQWRPGCVAVDVHGNQWETTGGNDYSGALEWTPINTGGDRDVA